MTASITVLIVEDDFLIRSCLAEFLGESDFQVIEAEDCASAERIFQGDRQIDVVVMDVSLPDGSGIDLGKTARAYLPDIPIIYTSGHGNRVELQSPHDHVLSKPYPLEKIVHVIHEFTQADRADA